jgi:hypothetical protein
MCRNMGTFPNLVLMFGKLKYSSYWWNILFLTRIMAHSLRSLDKLTLISHPQIKCIIGLEILVQECPKLYG